MFAREERTELVSAEASDGERARGPEREEPTPRPATAPETLCASASNRGTFKSAMTWVVSTPAMRAEPAIRGRASHMPGSRPKVAKEEPPEAPDVPRPASA